MPAPEAAVMAREEARSVALNPIDEILTSRFACREFCDAPVDRQTIEQILHELLFLRRHGLPPWLRLRRVCRERIGRGEGLLFTFRSSYGSPVLGGTRGRARMFRRNREANSRLGAPGFCGPRTALRSPRCACHPIQIL